MHIDAHIYTQTDRHTYIHTYTNTQTYTHMYTQDSYKHLPNVRLQRNIYKCKYLINKFNVINTSSDSVLKLLFKLWI